MRPETDRQKVTAWLNKIHATPEEAQEVLQLCATDNEARIYFVEMHKKTLPS